MRPSLAFTTNRALIRQVVAAHRGANPRVFGSVLRGEDIEGSDLDLLVDAMDATTLFDLAGIELELEKALGIAVHVVTSGALQGELKERVLAEAEPV